MGKKRNYVQPTTENEVVKSVGTPPEANLSNHINASAMPFGKSNYTVMLIGIGLILTGFFIMTLDKEEFGFGFLGITLGPIVAFIGFMVEFYAILKKK